MNIVNVSNVSDVGDVLELVLVPTTFVQIKKLVEC